MKLLVDANILLDVMQVREPYVKGSSLIWKLCETGEVEGYVSAMTFANLIYVMRKELDPQAIHYVLNKLQLIFHITALSETDLKQASEMEWKDFEDAIQCATAERIGADFIITRNVKDFLQSRKVLAFTPSEFLGRYI